MRLRGGCAAGASAAMLMAAASSPALAGSVIRPGDTIGNPAGKPIPPGLYFVNTLTHECRDIANHKTCATPNVAVIAWSTPWTVAGARLHILAAPLVPLHLGVKNAPNRSGLFNPFIGAQLAWDLGQDFSVSYLLGTYVKTHGEVAYSSTSLNQRLGLTYTGDGLNLTANVILGTHFDKVSHRPQISPCPSSAAHPSNGCNPDYLNIDLTATKKFGDWELGPVGAFSTDLNKPTPEYKKQSQFQLGGLVGRNINNKAIVQLYVTADVYQKNYGASIVTGNFRIILPIKPPKGAPLQPITN